MKNELSVSIIQEQDKFLLIDTSEYLQGVKCFVYDLTPPSLKTAISIQYEPNKILVVDSKLLWDNSCNLTDGLWKIKQSVSPNDKVFKDHCFFYIGNLKKELMKQLDKLEFCKDNLIEFDKYVVLLSKLLYLENSGTCDERKSNIIYNSLKEQIGSINCNC